MLDPSVVRLVAAAIPVAYIAGAVFLQRHSGLSVRRSTRMRAEDRPPGILQVLWEAAEILPNLYPFAVAVLPSWTYGTALNFALPYDAWAQVAGLLAWTAGFALAGWSATALGRHMTVQIAVAEDHALITSGPYARARHPYYLAVMLMVAGVALFCLSDLLLVAFLVVTVLADYRARKEERLLASPAGFGDAYRAYMARTGRFLPRIWARPPER